MPGTICVTYYFEMALFKCPQQHSSQLPPGAWTKHKIIWQVQLVLTNFSHKFEALSCLAFEAEILTIKLISYVMLLFPNYSKSRVLEILCRHLFWQDTNLFLGLAKLNKLPWTDFQSLVEIWGSFYSTWPNLPNHSYLHCALSYFCCLLLLHKAF